MQAINTTWFYVLEYGKEEESPTGYMASYYSWNIRRY